MATATFPWTGDQLAAIARASLEIQRGGRGGGDTGYTAAVGEAIKTAGSESCAALLKELRAQMTPSASGRATAGTRVGGEDSGQAQELLKQRASLELKIQHEAAIKRDLESALTRQKEEHRHAMESLTFQQHKLKELQEERTRLLADIRKMEDKLRLQINETEQVQIKLQKFQESRKSLGDQAVDHTEQINALKAENELLKQQAELAMKERDTTRETTRAEVEVAESQTADSAFGVLWTAMGKELPQLFLATHVPNQKTFENVCEAFVELVRVMATIEAHVHQMLRDLRQVGEAGDKLAHFHVMFTKNPDLVATLRDLLTSRKRTGNFANLVRALQAWARAFGSGTYKAIAKAPVLMSEELNYRNWPMKKGFTESEEGAIGRYFRDTAYKAAPDKIGTTLRKEAGDLAYQDYNDLMKKR